MRTEGIDYWGRIRATVKDSYFVTIPADEMYKLFKQTGLDELKGVEVHVKVEVSL